MIRDFLSQASQAAILCAMSAIAFGDYGNLNQLNPETR